MHGPTDTDPYEHDTFQDFMKTVPECCERLEVDGLEDVLRSVELQQQHDENSMVRQLLELCLSDIMVLDQHPNYNTQHLNDNEGWEKTQVKQQITDSVHQYQTMQLGIRFTAHK